MQTIVKTPHYTLAVETSKNRLYWTPKGFWDATVKKAELINGWKQALKSVSAGFTILTDATQVKTLTKEWAETFAQIQELTVQAGLAASAEILPPDAITKMQAERVSRSSGMPREGFASKAEAEQWLDTL